MVLSLSVGITTFTTKFLITICIDLYLIWRSLSIWQVFDTQNRVQRPQIQTADEEKHGKSEMERRGEL
jgi:hypothetical protein